jgi:hypothetical protein
VESHTPMTRSIWHSSAADCRHYITCNRRVTHIHQQQMCGHMHSHSRRHVMDMAWPCIEVPTHMNNNYSCTGHVFAYGGMDGPNILASVEMLTSFDDDVWQTLFMPMYYADAHFASVPLTAINVSTTKTPTRSQQPNQPQL